MANLLPQKERKHFEWEYRFRVVTIVLLFCMATLVFGSVLLLPSYFISQSKGESIERQSELLKKTIALREGDASIESLFLTKQKIDALVKLQAQVPQTKIIHAIIQNLSTDVSVHTFNYVKGEMKIAGSAQSRKALILFSDQLKKEKLFNDVDLPVSSLARDSDITFSITLRGDF